MFDAIALMISSYVVGVGGGLAFIALLIVSMFVFLVGLEWILRGIKAIWPR